jgi:16S rRNA (adenine1518-N6/adenine1519-N6)-dimethyltransferase
VKRDAFARYRERMEALGFRPSSARGQNFLLDPSLHRLLADLAAPSSDDVALEIGAGLGFLTRELALRAGTVVAVEIDDRLASILRAELQSFPNVRILVCDALGGAGRRLPPAILEAVAGAPRLVVAANLPYSVTGALMGEIFALSPMAARAVLLVQREIAQRLAASPGTADYGGLSAQLQSCYRIRVVREVAPEVFRPRPKVVSAILLLELREDRPIELVSVDARRHYAAFVRALFQQRRKSLRTTLKAAVAAIDGRLPEQLGSELLARRAESLDADSIVRLWCDCRQPSDASG